HAATVTGRLAAGGALTVVLSAEAAPERDGAAAWHRRREHEQTLLGAWREHGSAPSTPPEWIERLVLAADQFIVRRGAGGRSVIAGYPWFGDWGRDTMVSLPGLTLVTGRGDVTRQILTTFAAFVDRG